MSTWARRTLKILVALVAAFGTLVALYRLASPEIVVQNEAVLGIAGVDIDLPDSRVRFGPIAAQTSQTIYYSDTQSDGDYTWVLHFDDGSEARGHCGHVTGGEYGKRLTLRIDAQRGVSCIEGNKIR